MKHFFVLGILLLSLAGVLFTTPVFALTVSPAKLEVSGDPGKTITGEIQLFNEQEGTQTFYPSFANFDSNGETGAPHFLTAQDDLATWITTDSQVTLEKDELKKVAFSITIPSNAEPGGHFAAIFWGNQPPSTDGGGQVAIGGKVGILVLLKVSGAIKEGGGLLDFSTKNKQKFYTTLPVFFDYRVSNTGGDRMVPAGEIKIKNLFVWPSATLPANPKRGSVLPNSTRKLEVIWGQDPGNSDQKAPGFFVVALAELKNFHFGWYIASLNLKLGSDKTANASFNFFVIPWQLLLILLIILLIVGFFGKMALKRYNKMIISKAISQQNSK